MAIGSLRGVLLTAWAMLAVVLGASPDARAAAGGWAASDAVAARLVAAVDAAGALERVPLGLHVRLKPGWKTYWRSPGDAGLPPRLDWAGSANLARADMRWPAPHRMTLFGIETFGYDGEVVFPLDVVPAVPGRGLDLKARVDLLVCSEICVPQRLDIALAVPAGPVTPAAGDESNLIARFAAQVPGDGLAAGLTVESVRAAGTPGRPELQVVATAREPFETPDLFVEAGPALAFRAPDIGFGDGGRRATLRLAVADAPAEGVALEGRTITLTLVDGRRAMETSAMVAPGFGAGDAGATVAAGLPGMLAMALLGGLILNLMPCVLPVLSLKLLSVVRHGGAAPGTVRAGFLASAAGILFSFLVLAGGLIALKMAGAAVGWGIQFQQPLFLVFMIVLLTLFASNLWGLFEVPLPRFLADAAVRHGGGASLGGHFATGAFATLLATPCSAPFLGTAVGFALARGPVEILAVFTALGIGLALPYLLVAAAPGVAAALPRPGRWMVGLRAVLGGALALTGVWLLTVLAVQVDVMAAQVVGGLMAGLVATLALRHRLVAVALAAAAFMVPPVLERTADAAPRQGLREEARAVRWVPFDEAAIREQVAAGRTVFVDVTADWCLTCQVNKTLVVNRAPVAGRLADGVMAMKADWTRPDERIAAFLARHGRYGIPFNIVYGPGAPDGIALPELLTESAVLEALDRAARL